MSMTNAQRQAAHRARRRDAQLADLHAAAPSLGDAVRQCQAAGLVVCGLGRLTRQLNLELTQ